MYYKQAGNDDSDEEELDEITGKRKKKPFVDRASTMLFIYVYVCVYICIYIYICKTYIYIYIHVYICVHLYVCIHIYIYIYMYIYTYTSTMSSDRIPGTYRTMLWDCTR